MNLTLTFLGACKKNAVVAAMLIALMVSRQSIHAQTSAATNALRFSNGGAVALNQLDLPPPWTAEMWVYRANAVGASAALFNSAAYGLKLEQFGSPSRNVGVTVYGSADYYFNYTAPEGTWTHLAFVGTASGVTLYVNGVATDTISTPISLPLNQFASLTTDYLNAIVDEVAVWNYARAAADIKSSYQFPTAPQSGLVLLWHFDESSGQVVTDSSGNGNNGIINNATRVTSIAPIYWQTILIKNFPDGSGPSLPQAVTIANRVGNMIINFSPMNAGGIIVLFSELDITNNMTIDGSSLSPPVTYATPGNRHFVISPSVNVTISGLNLANGEVKANYPASSLGGSISNAGNLILNNVVFTGNQAVGQNGLLGGPASPGCDAGGGAIFNTSTGTLTLNQCTFVQNTASGGNGVAGGGNSGNGGTARGGAIYNSGTMTANLSSFYDQTNTGGLADEITGPDDTSVSGSALGGVIYNDTPATAVLNECTLASNTVAVPGPALTVGGTFGDAIYSLGQLTLRQSTVAGNLFAGTSGVLFVGGGVYQTGSASLFNTILADGVRPSLHIYSSFGENLIGDFTGLAPLDNYGGPTLTMPPIAGSRAIDAGADMATNSFPTDQRGFPRLVGAHVDIGAVEATPPLLNTPQLVMISTNTGTGTYTLGFSVNTDPNGAPTTVNFQYGALPFAASNSVSIPGAAGFSPVSTTADISRGYEFYWNAVAINVMGSTSTATMSDFTPAFATDVPGDLNGDGVVSQSELNQVYASYLATSPYLLITNAVGLGQSNVNLAISNGLVLTYTVQVSSNLLTWTNLGPALPLYNFTDTNAPAAPQRYYRLVYP